MKATVNIAHFLGTSRSMYDSEVTNGKIIRTTAKGAVLIEGDHKTMGRVIVWIAPFMIQKQMYVGHTTTYIIYPYTELKYKSITNQ